MSHLDHHLPPEVQSFFDAHPDWIPQIPSHVPAGWDALVAAALADLLCLSLDRQVRIQVAQVKEKFGALRLYLDIDEVSAGPLEIVDSRSSHTQLRSSSLPGSVRALATAIVDAAAARSRLTCAFCGAAGQVVDRGGHLISACPRHAEGGTPVDDQPT